MRLFKRKAYINAEVVYELKPGSHYLIEYSSHAVSKNTAVNVSQALESYNIHATFVSNPTNHRAFEPIPATPALPTEAQDD